jgi:chromate transporter
MLELFSTFFLIGLFTIGGGYVMIPVIQKEVLINGWLSSQQFKEILAISEMTPGPIAINTATFVGYKIGGFWGAIFATTGVVLPSFIVILLISKAYEIYATNRSVRGFMSGITPAVSAIILSAVITVGKGSVNSLPSIVFCLIAFIILYKTKLNLIFVLLIAGIVGLIIF